MGPARFLQKAYIGSSDSYGSATQPIYWDDGVPKATSYSLNATINAGTTNHLAYYSGNNAISSGPNICTDGTSYFAIKNDSNNAYDALFYLENNASNDWTAKFVNGTSNYGLYIEGTGTNLLKVGTNSNFYVNSDYVGTNKLFKVTMNSNTLTIGSQNVNFTHIYNSASIPFIVNNSFLTTTGNLGNESYPWNNLYIGKTGTKNIYYVGTKATYSMIRFIDNTSDIYGNGISIGGGGQVVIGSGESATAMDAISTNGGTETTFILSDGAINIEANGNTIANRIGAQVTTGGHIIPIKAEAANTNAQSLGVSGNRWSKLFVGTADTYGSATQPIYWNAGVPTAITGAIANNTTGNAATATKLATARTITKAGDLTGSFSFDGSGNITDTAYIHYLTASRNNSNTTYAFHRILTIGEITSSYYDASAILILDQGYVGGCYGIARAVLRTNNISASAAPSCEITWLIRKGFAADDLQWGLVNNSGNATADIYYRRTGTYDSCTIRVLQDFRAGIGRRWTLINSVATGAGASGTNTINTEVYTGVNRVTYTSTGSAYDTGNVNYANIAEKDSSGNTITSKYVTLDTAQTITGTKTFSAQPTLSAGWKWPAPANVTATASANNQEWSIDLSPGSYTGTYWHVWSGTNSASILQCYNDNRHVAIPVHLYIGGYNNTSYALSTASFICNSWVRTKGSTGWYNEDYGGGWYMSDSTWIRSYGSKNIYHNTGIMRTDGTFQVGGDGTYVSLAANAYKIGSTSTTSNQITLNGHVVVNGSYNTSNSYSEGIRINRSTNGWAIAVFGGTQGTTSGTGLGTWLVGASATPADATTAAASITNSNFYISYNGSSGAACRITGHNANGFSARPRFAINADVNTSYTLYVNGTSALQGNVVTTTNSTWWLGTFTANTAGTGERQIGLQNGAGKLYMYSQAATTGGKGLYGCNAAGTYASYLAINQSNQISGLATLACNVNFITDAVGVVRAGVSRSWYNAHTGSLIRSTSVNGLSPLWSIKSTNGFLIGAHYNSGNYANHWMVGFLHDDDVEGATNASNRWRFSAELIVPNIATTSDRNAFVTVDYNGTTAQKGSGTQPVYIDSTGVVQNTTYSLNATVNAGTARALAYYSDANTISSSTRTRLTVSNRYPLDLYLYKDSGIPVGEMFYDTGNATNVTAGRWYWRMWSPNSTADTSTTGYYETYSLPTVTTGRTTNASYDILTTKNHAAPSQGTASRIAYYSAAGTISSGTATTNGAYLGNVSYLSINTAHQTTYRLYVAGTTYTQYLWAAYGFGGASTYVYGTTLPTSNLYTGRIFFKIV